MFEKLKFLFFSLLTIRHEVQYVSGALIEHKVDLPKNYWRFTLLRPFIDVDKGTSSLMRNFCPLFWVTNLLAAAYIVLCPLIVLVYVVAKITTTILDWGASFYAQYQAKKTLREETEEKKEEPKVDKALNLKIKFSANKVFQQFYTGRRIENARELHCYILEEYEDAIREQQGEDSTFNIADITEEQIRKFAEEGLSEDEKIALIFVYQYKQEWRVKFDGFIDEITGAEKRKQEKHAAWKASVEKRFQKVMPNLVKASKGFVFGIGATALVALVALVCWGVYLWFFPAMDAIIELALAIFGYLTSTKFLTNILYLLGGAIAVFILAGAINLPFMMLEDKITEWCERYYVASERKKQSRLLYTPFHHVGNDRIGDGGFKSAFILMFICRFFDLVSIVLEAIISVVAIPFVFFQMFYAKNCPAITVVDPNADTNTSTQPEDS